MNIRTQASLAWALMFSACGGSPPKPDGSATIGRVPVVMIVFDALDAEHLSHLGYPRKTTPHMDQLAGEGVSFRHAFSPAPYTLAGAASLVTGRLPDHHGVVAKQYSLRESEVTIAELLGGAGYASLAVVGNPNGGAAFNALQGFDQVVETYTTSERHPANYTPPSLGTPVHLSVPEDAVRELGPFLDGLTNPQAPFFFYAHVLQPHSPYSAPEELRGRWLDPGYEGRFAGGHNQQLIAQKNGREEIGAADIQAVIDLYDANLLWADHALGQMLAELKRRGLYEKSLIIVTSDHGEAMWQHGVWGHNDTLFDEMLQVPLIVRLPGPVGDEQPRGLILDPLASTMDVLPSLAEWLDLGLPGRLDGISLASTIASRGQLKDTRVLRLRDHNTPPSVALRSATAKGILNRGRRDSQQAVVPPDYEYFDLVADPKELAPIKASADPRAGQMYQRLVTALNQTQAQAQARAASTLSDEDERARKAIGYGD